MQHRKLDCKRFKTKNFAKKENKSRYYLTFHLETLMQAFLLVSQLKHYF